LLICEKKENKIKTILRYGVITNLGGKLKDKNKPYLTNILKTTEVLKNFKEICEKNKVSKVIVVGTEALRRARNVENFLKKVNKIPLSFKVISDKEESELSFLANSFIFKNKELIVIDQGGGSIEFSYGKDKKIKNFLSIKIGVIYLKELLQKNSYFEVKKYLRKVLLPSKRLVRSNKRKFSLCCLGGTITALVALEENLYPYNPDKVHGYKLKKKVIEKWLEIFTKLSFSELKRLKPLEKERAPYLLGGTLALSTILEIFKKDFFLVSEWGLKYGLVLRED
jgi:exopolyphosphatase/guanosine-5'-triphosphate,3'-diphosphate pyrophosphatase